MAQYSVNCVEVQLSAGGRERIYGIEVRSETMRIFTACLSEPGSHVYGMLAAGGVIGDIGGDWVRQAARQGRCRGAR